MLRNDSIPFCRGAKSSCRVRSGQTRRGGRIVCREALDAIAYDLGVRRTTIAIV